MDEGRKGGGMIHKALLGNTSLSPELKKNWRVWVCLPITKYPFAPRYARACLEIIGKLLAEGTSIETIVDRLKGDNPDDR